MKTVKGVIVASKREGLVDRLRDAVEGVTFVPPEDANGAECLAILDYGQREIPPAVLLTVKLCDGEGSEPWSEREIHIPTEAFLSAPSTWIRCWDNLLTEKERSSSLEEKLEVNRSVAELLATRTLESVFEKVTEKALGLAGFEHGTLLFYDSSEERYTVSFTNDPEMKDDGGFLPGVPAGLLQEAMETDSDFGYEPSSGSTEGLLVVPLRVEEDTIGLLSIPVPPGKTIDARRAARAFHYLRGVALLVSTSFHLTRSNELAMRDDLTRAFNRRFFESYLNQEIERGVRYGTIFSIIFLDLDDLKSVNDMYGHISGSRTLQEVAKRILGAVRAIDRVVRFGGDEFCIILPQTDEAQAKAVAERVRTAICDHSFSLGDDIEVEITASFGIAAFPRHAKTKDELVRRADDAMYQVKTSSKNSIGVAAGDE
jgi:diguanylate cyclase (GGDEF)-like protein